MWHFVDDIDLVAAPPPRRKFHLIAQLPDLVDATVRGRVDLDQVERGAARDGAGTTSHSIAGIASSDHGPHS
jgi:hypothetical protein